MAEGQKTILVIAQHNKVEAMRMASGLTLLDDIVKVDVLGVLGDDDETAVQMEALEFAEVPVTPIDAGLDDDIGRFAEDILAADAVYVI